MVNEWKKDNILVFHGVGAYSPNFYFIFQEFLFFRVVGVDFLVEELSGSNET